MKHKELKKLTLQVALAGIALGGLTSVAGAHGNNPKDVLPDGGNDGTPRRRLDLDTPFDPPPAPQNAERLGGDAFAILGRDSFDSYWQGIDLSLGDLSSDFDLRTMMGEGGDLFASHVTVEHDGPIHGIPGGTNGLGVGPNVQVPTPPPGVVPAPGALGLLGLAALTIRSRRRRH